MSKCLTLPIRGNSVTSVLKVSLLEFHLPYTPLPSPGTHKHTQVWFLLLISLNHLNLRMKLYIILALERRRLALMPLFSFSGLHKNALHIYLAHTILIIFFDPIHGPIPDFNCENHTNYILFVPAIYSLLIPCSSQ